MSTSNVVTAVPGPTANVRTASVRVGGQEVRYHDSVDEAADHAPVVLVHGTGGSTQRHFRFLFPMLATRQRVVSIDLATGDVPAEEGPARFAEQVAAVVEEALPGRTVALTGYSLGAVVSAVVAATRPDLVGKLVLLAGWMKTDAQQRLRNEVWLALRRAGDLAVLGRFAAYCAYSAPFLALRTPSELDALVTGVAADDATAAQMEMNRVVDLTSIAPRITCPTLIVAGTDDQMTPHRQSRRLFGAIEDARYTEVTSGHAMVAERPAELVRLVTTFNHAPGRHPAGSVLAPHRP
jgi:pimeloyl-ACP methyl ester carboxylesterase